MIVFLSGSQYKHYMNSSSSSERSFHVVIAGGGTGGHLFPGLAVAEELRKQGIFVSFVGTSKGIEARVVPQHGYPLHFIDVTGLKRQGFAGTLRSLLRLPKAFVQARTLLRTLRPDAVLGVGGYASGPMTILAARRKIPTAILEQNSIPGLTNRVAARFVKAIFLAFPEAVNWFPKEKIQLIGNPIRTTLLHRAKHPPSSKLRVLVLGGSQGAHAINQLVVDMSKQALQSFQALPWQLHHQTGTKEEIGVKKSYQEMGLLEPIVRVSAFVEDMAEAYAWADMVVGRAGATTLAEITALGLPSILIPLPTAADDHQTHNAAFLSDAQAAYLLPQVHTSPSDLLQKLMHLQENSEVRLKMAANSKSLGKPSAAEDVARILCSWAEERKVS